MDSWKQSLDRYLTTPPEDPNEFWYESIEQEFTEEFWDEHEDEFLQNMLYYKWADKLANKAICQDVDENGNWATFGYVTPKLAAQIIERAYNIYIKNVRSKKF